jgi:hypothetical protein
MDGLGLERTSHKLLQVRQNIKRIKNIRGMLWLNFCAIIRSIGAHVHEGWAHMRMANGPLLDALAAQSKYAAQPDNELPLI